MPANLLSTVISGGFVTGVIMSRWFYSWWASQRSVNVHSPRKEIVAEARKVQLPAQHAVEELEAFLDRAVLAMQMHTPLDDVLGYRSELGARVYAFNRRSPPGARVHAASEGSPADQAGDRLTARELAVWEYIARKGGGWCAYVVERSDGRFSPEYVYVRRPQLPNGPDVYLSVGFSL